MSYHLFLDDIRDPSWVNWIKLPHLPDAQWVIVRNFEQFVQTIQTQGMPGFISFDHDLDAEGEFPDERTGMDCAKWLVNHCLDQDIELPGYAVHSYNPVGRDNIQGLLDGFGRFRAKTSAPRPG